MLHRKSTREASMPHELLGGLEREADAQCVEFDLTAKQDKMRTLKDA